MKRPLTPPSVDEVLQRLIAEKPAKLVEVLQAGSRGLVRDRYRHWESISRLKSPPNLSHEEWWLAIKLARIAQLRPLPLQDTAGTHFSFSTPDPMLARLYDIDQKASGSTAVSDVVTNSATRDRYVISSLMEEAITSSQLEGAVTTRRAAKDMLISGREPRTRDERMVLNNYLAMTRLSELKDERLTTDLVLELHRLITAGTLHSPDAEGRLQRPSDERVAVFAEDGNPVPLHLPPPATELPDRLFAMCRFANGRAGHDFLHPVVRSIILHFWLAYDHPFADGNGRTARALFYWSMLRQGYWLAEFLAISSILRKAPGRYRRSFLYSESDDDDLTYFILYQTEVICRAIDALHAYLERKLAEVQKLERSRRAHEGLNHRQLALVSHSLRHPGSRYTFETHRRSHGVTYQSARTDLLALVERGLLEKHQVGRQFVFFPAADLTERFGDSRPPR